MTIRSLGTTALDHRCQIHVMAINDQRGDGDLSPVNMFSIFAGPHDGTSSTNWLSKSFQFHTPAPDTTEIVCARWYDCHSYIDTLVHYP